MQASDTPVLPAVSGEVAPAEGEVDEAREQMFARLAALGGSLATKRAEAIQAREQSGIESDWFEDEEFYQGIDDANRGEHRSNWLTKPPGQAAAKAETSTRSTVFPNITRPYVDAGAARIADMLLPTDDRSWSLAPTPIPEAVDAAKKKYSQQMLQAVAQKYPGQPQLAEQELATATKAAQQVLDEAKAKADKAQKRIEDWHVECQWHANVRLVIEDSARIGTGVLKGPVPIKKKNTTWRDNKVERVEKLQPGSKWINPWNFFPAPDCGENIHNGSYTWERDDITRRQLRELKGQEGYIDEQIDMCLKEGPIRATAQYLKTPDEKPDEQKKDNFDIWYFHGTLEREDLEAAGVDTGELNDPHIPAVVTMVNNRVIKVVLNPLDTGDFPYDVMVWQRRTGYWAGVGIARQIRTPQRIVTAATRNLMDNAGLASGVMLVFKQGTVYPADGVVGIAPRKMWYIAEDADGMEDATKAIGQIKVDMLVSEMMEIIQLGLKLAEDVTGLPMLLQGQQGKAPDTVGGMQMLNNNASAVLRRLARLFDDRVTEPHVRRYYDWLLQYGEDDEKGDYCIDARGSSALVERDLQNQAVAQMGNIVLDPRFGLDPKKWAQEFLKSQRLDAKRFAFDDEKWQQIVEKMAQGPQDPRMAIAELKMQSEERQRQFDAALREVEMRFEESENERDRQLEYIVTEMEQTGKASISLTDLKGKLADTTIKVRAQREMADKDRQNDARQVATPPTEPKGRAKPGRAYQA